MDKQPDGQTAGWTNSRTEKQPDGRTDTAYCELFVGYCASKTFFTSCVYKAVNELT